ncbi:MAG: aldolase/citrate lyase family protein [bacterium]
MRGRDIREAMRSGRRLYGTLIVSFSPVWPSAVRQAGIDFVFIDTEHIPLDRTLLSSMCHDYRAMGLPPIVRVPSPDPFEACKVLDGGAAGIIAPYVESVDQVRDLVGATKLRPLKGKRLAEALKDLNTLEPELRDYIEQRNADTVLVINVESVPAVENLDAILDIPGLDGVLIGPHDLSCSLAVPEQYHHPRFKETVQTIIKKCRKKQIGVGAHYSEALDLEIEWGKAGANFMVHAGDISIFSKALRNDIDELRRALGDTAEKTGDGDTLIV